MPEFITETPRLILRQATPEDVLGFYELDSDPDVHRFLGNKPVQTMEECLRVISWLQQQYAENGIGRWSVIDKTTGEFVGWAGLKFVREETNGHVDYYDLGYRLKKKFWGRGLASECAAESLRYGFEILKLKEIYAAAHIENVASNHILHKCGFIGEGRFVYDGAIHNWYRIDRLKWLFCA